MRITQIAAITLIQAAALGPLAPGASAQQPLDEPPLLVERNLSGPRLGLTFVGIAEHLKPYVEHLDIPRVVSQFGWHFEHQISPTGGGPQFVIQFVPLIAGVEHGKFLPSVTFAMGIRFPSGIEAGLGPNLQIADDPSTGLVIGIGKSFNYGGVNIPVNLAYTLNPNGNRFTILLGYAIQRGPSRPIGRR